jgi:hypothetical protein
VLWDRLYD